MTSKKNITRFVLSLIEPFIIKTNKYILINLILGLFITILILFAFHNKYIVIALILFVYFILCFIYKNVSKYKYDEGGYLADWYIKTYKLLGPTWSSKIYNLLIQNNIISIGTPLVLISPSGNQGKYEKELFYHACAINNPVKFIVSDLANLKIHENNVCIGTSEYIHFGKADALNILNTINECSIKSVDIIWDFKGAIWHSFDNDGTENLELLLHQYHNALSDQGILIIDNIKPKWHPLPYFIWEFTSFMIGLVEKPTWHKLNKEMARNRELLKQVDRLFSITELKDSDDYTVSIVVLKKRIVSTPKGAA